MKDGSGYKKSHWRNRPQFFCTFITIIFHEVNQERVGGYMTSSQGTSEQFFGRMPASLAFPGKRKGDFFLPSPFRLSIHQRPFFHAVSQTGGEVKTRLFLLPGPSLPMARKRPTNLDSGCRCAAIRTHERRRVQDGTLLAAVDGTGTHLAGFNNFIHILWRFVDSRHRNATRKKTMALYSALLLS